MPEIGDHLSIRDLVLELRELVLTTAPQAAEALSWKGLVYFRPELGGPMRG